MTKTTETETKAPGTGVRAGQWRRGPSGRRYAVTALDDDNLFCTIWFEPGPRQPAAIERAAVADVAQDTLEFFLWKLERNLPGGYDTYDGAVVIAPTELEARHIYPDGDDTMVYDATAARWVRRGLRVTFEEDHDVWPAPMELVVMRLGRCESPVLPRGRVVLASFRAG